MAFASTLATGINIRAMPTGDTTWESTPEGSKLRAILPDVTI